MKIAVTYENGDVFQHFGQSKQFKIYEVDNAIIVNTEVVPVVGEGHGALADFLSAQGVNTLICGGIGAGAQKGLVMKGIKYFGGVTGSADAVVQDFLKGELKYDPDVKCNHHDHKHGEGHKHECHGEH